MTDFTDVFHALDHDNKGYILFVDFKNEIQKFLHGNDETYPKNFNTEREKTFNKFLNLFSQNDDSKIYLDDLIKAIETLKSNEIVNCNTFEENPGEDNSQHQIFINNDSSPFINDGDSYSTGDSGLDNESRVGIGKQNRKRIKAVQNHDVVQSGETLKRHYSENESINFDDIEFPRDQIYQQSFSDFTKTDLKSSYNCVRRQSDFVTCASNRIGKNHRYDRDDDESKSFNGWNGYSGSVTDLYYHDSMNDLREKLEKLELSMDNLQMTTTESKHSKRRWMEENQNLKTQMHILEDTIRQQKKEYQKLINQEKESSRKSLNKLELSKQDDVDILNHRLKSQERNLDGLRKELNQALGECERLKYDKLRSEDKLGDLQQQMSFIEDDMRRLKDFHSRELELLTREQNRLVSNIKFTESGLERNKITTLLPNNLQQLQDEVKKLRIENRDLKTKLETCEEEFLVFSIQQGNNVLQGVSIDNTWMNEIDGYTKIEVIELLVKEKDANYRLREYVNSILTRIIERDPSLLEIA